MIFNSYVKLPEGTDLVSSYFCLFITPLYHHVCLTHSHFYWDVSQIRVRILGSPIKKLHVGLFVGSLLGNPNLVKMSHYMSH